MDDWQIGLLCLRRKPFPVRVGRDAPLNETVRPKPGETIEARIRRVLSDRQRRSMSELADETGSNIDSVRTQVARMIGVKSEKVKGRVILWM